jgi:hypothetical protein
MKIRNGFVSNSSSSSFLIVLPDDYTIDKNEVKLLMNEYELEDIEEVIKNINNFINEGEIYEYDDYNYFSIMSELFRNYNIFGVDVGSDDGIISFMKKQEIINKINKIK